MGIDFTPITNAINTVLTWIWNAITAIFTSLWDIATDLISWAFDQVLGVAIGALNIIDVSNIVSQLGWFNQIPDSVRAVMAAAGLGSALGIVMSAIAIRFALQLIPFTRLGS